MSKLFDHIDIQGKPAERWGHKAMGLWFIFVRDRQAAGWWDVTLSSDDGVFCALFQDAAGEEGVRPMLREILLAIEQQQPVVLMFEGPEGSVIQRKVKPKGLTGEQQLVAYCLKNSEEFTVSIPEVIGLRYWPQTEE